MTVLINPFALLSRLSTWTAKQNFSASHQSAGIDTLHILGRGYTDTGNEVTTTTTVPFDDTAPSSTEGAQLLTLAYTPKKTGSRLIISFGSDLSVPAGFTACLALFKDSDASSMASRIGHSYSNGAMHGLHGYYEMDSPAAGVAITFKTRFGGNNAGTARAGGSMFLTSRIYGGRSRSFIQVLEVE